MTPLDKNRPRTSPRRRATSGPTRSSASRTTNSPRRPRVHSSHSTSPRTTTRTLGTRGRSTSTSTKRPVRGKRGANTARSSSKSTQKGKYKQRIEEKTKLSTVPPVASGDIRIVPLGGFEQIGKNMSVIEIGEDIIVIDAGFQFRNEDTPGIDYILPNTKYLEDRKDKIRGVVITHGHLDHIGGIPYIWPRIGNPKIYCRLFTKLMIQKRQEEFKNLPPLDIEVVETRDTVKLGAQTVQFFGITHTIPDSMGIIIKTPHGNLINQADFKLDHVEGVVSEEERKEYERVSKEKTLLLMADSTNVENEGFSTPEWMVHRDLEKIIKSTKDRLIMGAFASQIERLIKVIEIAEKYDRHVVLEGRSMRTNLEVAKEAEMLKPKTGTMISAEESLDVPPHKVLILATGSQGEEFAALNRMANKTHKILSFNDRDTVVLSSSIVPGNEMAVQKLKDNIARSGPRIVTYRNSEFYVHGSGHGNREELAWLHQKLKPHFFMPQHGSHYMLRLHADLAHERGMSKENIVIADNGNIIEIKDAGTKIVKRKEKAASDLVTVDGFNIGNVQDVVIRDRQVLSEDGIFIVVVSINPRDGKLRKSPDIISRGFVYLRESKDLIQEARQTVVKLTTKAARGPRPIDFDDLKSNITDHIRKLLLQRTAKRPLVIPVVLGI